jgi:glucose-6-phosphate isomerase
MEKIDISKLEPDIRRLSDMAEVILDKEWLNSTDKDLELYYMYRAVKEEGGLRYDITVIPPMMLGEEFIKTKGHFHASGHPEYYTVLEGEALFLMQERDGTDAYFVKAKEGDSIIIKGNYGHITINPGSKVLKMANWISPECISEYSAIGEKEGACWFYTINGWVKNSNYENIPALREEQPLEKEPESFGFLKESI